jgi:CRP-like cAMP-binding protein
VAQEQTDAISVPFEDVMEVLLKKPELVAILLDVFCRALKEAYLHVNILAMDDTVHRLIRVVIGLAHKIGQRSGTLIEIPTYLTQEEIAQMVAARREGFRPRSIPCVVAVWCATRREVIWLWT